MKKKRRLNEELKQQTKNDINKQSRLDVEAEGRRVKRVQEQEETKQNRLREQALRQQALREEENEEERHIRLQEKARRQQALCAVETYEERRDRLMEDKMRHPTHCKQETVEGRMSRASVDRLRHQMYLIVENHEEAEVRRELNREQMTTNRAAEIKKETEQRREESQLRMERLRQERQQDEELLRAMNAMEQAEIIPLETEKDRTFREELLAARNRVGVPRTHRAACKVLASEDHLAMLDCGEMNVTCGERNARHFKGERAADKKFTQCCGKGKVILHPPKQCPQPLAKVLQNNHSKAKVFMTMIRNYNSAHDFDSLRANISSPPGRGTYCFRIHGQVYHSTTPVDANTTNPKYTDLYFMDAAQASEFRGNFSSNGGCYRNLMEELDTMLQEKNPYA
ncbi:Uncharacterized protein APZ42_028964, partial [Daphnia magna]